MLCIINLLEEGKMKFKKFYTNRDSSLCFSYAIIVPQIVLILFVIIVSSIVSSMGLTEEQITNSKPIIYITIVLSQIIFAAIVLIYSRVKRINFIQASKIKFKFNIWYFLLSVGLGALLLYGFSMFINLTDFSILKLTDIESANLPISIDSIGMFFVGILIFAVLPAVVEEFLFRGIIFNGLKQKFNAIGAITLSSLMFTIMHLNIYQVVYQFALGVVLAMIVYYTGSIFYSIILHFINNFLIVLNVYLATVKGSLAIYDTNWYTSKILMAIGIMLLTCGVIAGIFIVWHKIKKPQLKTEKAAENLEEEKKVSSQSLPDKALLIISICIGLAFWIYNFVSSLGA